MKDHGCLTYFLGLEISRSKKGTHVCQSKYVADLVKSARLENAKPFDTPLELNIKIGKNDGNPQEDPTLIRHLVSSLLYLTMTRPAISHAFTQSANSSVILISHISM